MITHPMLRPVSAIAAAALVPFVVTGPAAAAVTPGGTLGDSITVLSATGGDAIAPAAGVGLLGADFFHTFDTEIGTTDETYELNPTAADATAIALSAGRHLVLYNAEFRSDTPTAGANRAELQGKLNLAGSDLIIGRSQGYIRDASNVAQSCITTGGAIITVANDGDILKLAAFRSDANAGQFVARRAGFSAVQLLKLDDSWDYLSLEKTANDASAIGSTYTDVTYDTAVFHTGSAFTFTDGTGDITINTAGLYLVFANTGLEKPVSATRTSYIQHLALDGAEVAGSRVTTYLRGNGNGEDSHTGIASNGTILNVGAGQVLSVEVAKVVGNDSTIQGGLTGLTIVQLPPTAKYISLLDTTEQAINDAVADPVVFNTANSASNAEFSHAPGTSAVTVNTTSDYLFLGALLTEDDLTNDNADRTVVRTGWQIDGAGGQLAYGQGAEYLRDNTNTNVMGNWCGAVLDLTAGQTVELMTERMGHTDPAEGDVMGLTGLSIGSLKPSNDPAVSINNPLVLVPGATGAITTALLNTFDADTPATALTYTVDSAPTGGALNHTSNGPIGPGGTFTQNDIDNNRIGFIAGGVEVAGGFDFTVSDGSASDSSSFVVTIAWPTTTVTIAADANEVTEGGIAGWTVSTTPAPVGAGMTVDIAYRGTAADGSDFTGVATVTIAAGASTGDLDVPTSADTVFEGCEVITATVTGASGATVNPVIGASASATLAILDGPSAPAASNLTQLSIGSGTVPIDDIAAFNHDATYQSTVSTAGSPFFHFNGETNVTTFANGLPDDDFVFNDPGYLEPPGMSIDLELIAQAADLTGTVVVVEIGGQQNGTSLLLVDGVPHLVSKAGATNENAPTDTGGPGSSFEDLDWATDNAIVVPLTLTGDPLPVGVPTRIAVVYDISGGSVKWSVNGSAETSVVLLNQDNVTWSGANSNTMGMVNPQPGGNADVGGQNINAVTNPFSAGTIGSLAGGYRALSCVRLWNESTGGVSAKAGTAGSDVITATMTITGWVAGAGDLTAASGNGETYGSGVWTMTGPSAAVNAALAAAEFTSGAGTVDPTVIAVSISNGTGSATGSILISSVSPDTVYVDDSFAGGPGAVIADADGGAPVSPAILGYSAFTTLTEAMAAVAPAGTILVNDGDYSAENVSLVNGELLRLANTAGGVTIGNLAALTTSAIDLQGNTLIVGNTTSGAGIDCAITGSGSLTKNGTGLVILREVCTYTGTTTVNGGILRAGFRNADALQAELAGAGPVVVNAPGRLDLTVDVHRTIRQTGAISGDGSVGTQGDGTVVFDGPGPNPFSGGFELGDGGISSWDGVDTGARNGFVVVNHSGHLGTGRIRSRGSQLQAGTPGVVIPNDIDIDAGGFRNGGTVDFGFSGTIRPIGGTARGFGNYGLEGLDLFATGPINLDDGIMNAAEGSNNRDNGTWTYSGPISGAGTVNVVNTFDNGVVTFTGAHTFTGAATFAGGITYYNATHTGGLSYTVGTTATLAGTGSTDAPVTVNAGGTLSPGADGVGTFSTGGLTVLGTLEVDVEDTGGTGHDQVVVTGTVDLTGGTLSVVEGSAVEAAPAEIVIIDNDGADSLLGLFGTGVPFSADYLGSGQVGQVDDLGGGDGNDVTLYADGNSILGAWRLANFGSALNAGAGANGSDAGDHDALINLLEFGFGTDPGSRDNLPVLQDGSVNGTPVSAGDLDAVFTRRTDHDQPGSLRYTVQFSGDLEVFHDSFDTPTFVAASTDDPDYEVVSVPYPATLPDGLTARFFRVRVDLAE